VIVLNADDHRYLIEKLRIPPRRVSRVDNGAPTLGLPERLRKAASAPLRLLFFGSWIDRKGVPELVRAATALQDRQIDFTLTLAGIGQDAETVALTFPSPVKRRIEIRSQIARAEIPNLLAAHDVLIAPSWYEGMPLSVLEAAAAGLALVLTDISGHRQIVEAAEPSLRDRSAILLPPHQPYGIVKAVLGLAKDSNMLLELQMNARRLARRLSWDVVGHQLEAAYSRSLSE
jgi:glycosyltransferase involved in cell wall biosynthesis